MLEGLAASAVGVGAAPPSLRPPSRFRPTGEIREAWQTAVGPGGLGAPVLRGTAAQKAGIRYERKVLDSLADLLPAVKRSQWFRFREFGRDTPRWCQPDGLLHTEELTVIFEIKIRTMPEAWWQLTTLYAPVVQKALRPKRLALVQIFRSFDPAVRLPEPAVLLSALSIEVLRSAAPGVLTHVWKL
jgi:hypothetical protein